jgi:membrane associated rhomboid family serine protease
MGIYDRDYYRRSLPRGGFAHLSAWSLTTWLIVINIGIFFADGILRRVMMPNIQDLMFSDDPRIVQRAWLLMMGPLTHWGYFSTDLAVHHAQVWRFITFQFLHASGIHLLVNMAGLFFFGPIVEAHYGERRFIAFYLLCGLAGAVCYLLLNVARVLPEGPETPLVGASAGIFGLLVAAAVVAPDLELFYWFVPVTVKMLAIGGMLLAVYQVFALGVNAGGEAAHLGGGVLGFALMKNQHWLNPFAPSRASYRLARADARRRRRRALQKDWTKDLNR